jgi:hypothetical protein
MPSDTAPDFRDAELVLRLYELRREAVMRKSRDTISFTFWPKNWEEFVAILDFSHPDNAAWRQVVTYWEMVFGFGQRGIIDPELLVENSGEGILLFMKARPFIEKLRSDSPTAFQHTEWAATQTDVGRQKVLFFEQRFGDKLASPALEA